MSTKPSATHPHHVEHVNKRINLVVIDGARNRKLIRVNNLTEGKLE